MPRKRNKENLGLPKRCRWSGKTIFYRVPPGLEKYWDGKKSFPLGKTPAQAFTELGKRLEAPKQVVTVGDLLERYVLQVSSEKKPQSRKSDIRCYKELVRAFHSIWIQDIKPIDVYQYIEKRTAKIAARRERSLLSHAFTKAVEWGCIEEHPFKGEVRLTGEKARTRYIQDWEIKEIKKLQPKRKKGDPLPMLKAYIDLKYLIGLRQGDMLRLREFRGKVGDKIPLITGKTGKRIELEITQSVFDAMQECMKARPVHIGPWLFCNRRGKPYFSAEKGDASGFASIWRRMMDRVMAETKVTERFTEHDIRAKSGSDAKDKYRAQELLTHDSVATTSRAYRRKPEVIRPLK